MGRGRSLITILTLNLLYSRGSDLGRERSILALDSFQGFPEPSVKDKSPRNPKKGEWSESPNKQFTYSVENLLKLLSCAELDQYLKGGPFESSFRVVSGFFDDTTPALESTEIVLLYLDGDLYESIKTPLVNLSSRISVGGVIVIDDYKWLKDNDVAEAFPGARLAVEEFLENNANFSIGESIRGTPILTRIF